MGHYVIVLVQGWFLTTKEREDNEREREERREGRSDGYSSDGDSEDDSDDEDEASLLAFDLRDHSVQEAEIDVALFSHELDYSFTKYGENQILKYDSKENYPESFVCITVESFKPFKVKCEEMKPNERKLQDNTAQIYKDYFYAYGKNKDSRVNNELWSFDLKNNTWKLCQTSGEAPRKQENPIALGSRFHSFIFQDSLVVYGGSRYHASATDLFLLDFDSLTWTKVKQKEKYLEHPAGSNYSKNGGALYKDHLVTSKNMLGDSENKLCCLNLHTNTWSTFAFKDPGPTVQTNGWMVYNDLILTFVQQSKDDETKLLLVVLNLENFEICAPKSAEEEHFSALFMSQNESDVAFKVHGKLIPAHKSVLMKKSRYFEKVFNSGMAETKQDIIEISDCEYEVFKEYLRYIYQGSVNFGDENITIKLYLLADKYLQVDLCEKILKFFISNINFDIVYTVLDFARQQDILHVKNWCIKFLKEKLNIQVVSGLIKYLDHQVDPDFEENKKELIEKVFNFTIDKFSEIYQYGKGNMKLYEDFLIKNIEMSKIPSFANLLGGFHKLPKDKRLCFEKCTSQLRVSVFDFVQENIENIMESRMADDFPIGFYKDFTLYVTRNCNKKRMEPTKDEENPELKKTKK